MDGEGGSGDLKVMLIWGRHRNLHSISSSVSVVVSSSLV